MMNTVQQAEPLHANEHLIRALDREEDSRHTEVRGGNHTFSYLEIFAG